MEEDGNPRLDSGFSIKMAERMIVDSEECLDKQVFDLTLSSTWEKFLPTSQEQDLVKNWEPEKSNKEETDNLTKEMKEYGGHHVRISLEEVESFHKFSCRCHWLCGRCTDDHIFMASMIFFF